MIRLALALLAMPAHARSPPPAGDFTSGERLLYMWRNSDLECIGFVRAAADFLMHDQPLCVPDRPPGGKGR